ncbi:S-adenosyl-L-methionine-dependent methyltransferase [Daedaleopsis nitida]|nr:S-adenosyl-L-methionine-dependent methyltransferase [Daedaleopsis nitida]
MLSARLPSARSPLASLLRARTYSSPSLPPLPPPEQWRALYPPHLAGRRERVSLKHLDTARSVAHSFIESTPHHEAGKIVIEAFPGPGALSRALLELPSKSLRKLIILEDDQAFLKSLEPLQDDPRVTVVPMSGHSWDTYTHLEEQGLLQDVVTAPWEDEALPNLHFVSHLPHSVKGEQLIAQLYRCIPEHSWLFQYGRVPMHILMSEHVWSRLSGPVSSFQRCKLSIIGEATSDIKKTLNAEVLEPYGDHFYPIPASAGRALSSTRRAGQPVHAITSIPYAQQIIQRGMTDQWDYCLRRLFVLKSTSLKVALNSLAPGARTLCSPEQRVNVSKRIRDLNVADWALVLRAFDNWPFKPVDLLVTDAFIGDDSER